MRRILGSACAWGVFILALSLPQSKAQTVNSSRKQLFDDAWKFKLADEPAAKANDFDDKQWRTLSLPHDWSIEGEIDSTNAMGNDGGYFPAGTGWYRKTFTVPAALKGKRVAVLFGGVYMLSEVFINGKSLGVYPYGYSSFQYDLTEHLKYGTENVIAVRVDNSQQKNCRWYSGSGIYRHVWLQVTDKVYINPWDVAVTTPQVSTDKALVQVAVTVSNETAAPQSISFSASLLDNKQKRVGKKLQTIQLAANSRQKVVLELPVVKPALWSTDAPTLYTAQLEILQNGVKKDLLNTRFGIRSISYSAEKGFALNGKLIELNGGCVHHDNGCLGAAAYDRAEARKVELLKKAGFNAVRTSHNPPSEAFLDACDEYGLLVIDESFDGWRTQKNKYDYSVYFDAWAVKDVEAMVKRDRNHPSIIMWSIGNEIIERKEAQAVQTAKMLADAVKAYDKSRAVTSAMTTWDKDWAIFDPLMAEHDIAGYNYQLHHATADHERVPSRVIVQTESYPRDAFQNWKLVQEKPYIIGDFVWTAMDYLGESGIGRSYYPGEKPGQHWERNLYPWYGAYCGDVDVIGWRKPISHYRSMLYNNDEKLYVAVKEPNPASGPITETMWSVWPTWESWNWPGFEGKDITVEVYSKYPAVRLYLNDKRIGELPTTVSEEFKAQFTVPYTAGVLKAVGVLNGREVDAHILKTAGEAATIKLTPDRKLLAADGQDLSFIAVEIQDAKGNLQPNAENELTFTVEGQGSIVGVGNAKLNDVTSYAATTRKAWKGRALVVVKSSLIKGDIVLKVTAPGLKEAKVVLNAR